MERVLYWARLNTGQIAHLNREQTVLLLPLGQTQQHGPHLPQGTTTYTVRHIAREIADLLTLTDRDRTVVILPSLSYGTDPVKASTDPASWGCNLSLQPATLEAVVMDIAQGVVCGGFRYLFSIGNHTGPDYHKAVQRAFTHLRRRNPGLIVEDIFAYLVAGAAANAAPDLRTLARRRITPREQAAMDKPDHGGMRATAIMLALDPNLVATDYTGLEEITPEHAAKMPHWPGYYGGAPALAEADLGEAILSQQAYRAAALIRQAIDTGSLADLPHTP